MTPARACVTATDHDILNGIEHCDFYRVHLSIHVQLSHGPLHNKCACTHIQNTAFPAMAAAVHRSTASDAGFYPVPGFLQLVSKCCDVT